MVTVTATSNFVHDRIDAKRGDKFDIPESTAKELELRGLVSGKPSPAQSQTPASKPATPRRRSAPAPQNKKAPDPENKLTPQSTNDQSSVQNGVGEAGNKPQAE